MRFFGQLPFAVRLSTASAGPPIRCAYVVDPSRKVEPAEQRLRFCVPASLLNGTPPLHTELHTNRIRAPHVSNLLLF
jgi:hypothetical protein